jgi:hypothetical protein
VVQYGVVTSQDIPFSGRTFRVEGADGPPCFKDRWGIWACGHDHDGEAPLLPLHDAYEHLQGWTCQMRLYDDLEQSETI